MITELRAHLARHDSTAEAGISPWLDRSTALILGALLTLLEGQITMATTIEALQSDLDAIKTGLADVPNRITAVVAAAVAAQAAADDTALAAAEAEAKALAAGVAALAQPTPPVAG